MFMSLFQCVFVAEVKQRTKAQRKAFSVSFLGGFIQKIPHLLEMGINAVEH